MKPALPVILAFLCTTPFQVRAYDAVYERAPINYADVKANDPVARLAQKVESGQAIPKWDQRLGYLPWLLDSLGIPASSQTLVFSKTSFQRDLIAPHRPRALYFNDDNYIGFVQGGEVLEISSVDPANGPMFYVLTQNPKEKPRFVRQNDACLQCHASSMTQDVPGHMVRSVYTDAAGQPILSAGTFRTTHASPIKQRWGGWYVTGTSGRQQHMGNVTVSKENPEQTDFAAGTNVKDLSSRVDLAPYFTRHSDIVALMVLEHQHHIHNLITRANFLTRSALHDSAELNKALNRPADYRSDSTLSRLKNAAEPLVRALLFCEETSLIEPVKGTSDFARDFLASAIKDPKGRSLRELDLKTRLFRYPCSYLIHSAAFEALPADCQDRVFKRIHEILTGADTSPDFAHLAPQDKSAILEILAATKKQCAQWRK